MRADNSHCVAARCCPTTGGGDTTDDTTLRTRLRYWLLLSVPEQFLLDLLCLQLEEQKTFVYLHHCGDIFVITISHIFN